jgi:hypothetical protein
LPSFLAVEGPLKQFDVVVVCVRSKSAHSTILSVRKENI